MKEIKYLLTTYLLSYYIELFCVMRILSCLNVGEDEVHQDSHNNNCASWSVAVECCKASTVMMVSDRSSAVVLCITSKL